ncbi:hypothetical protein EGW08_007253, partial [Elysia chlorotica]
RRKLQKSFRSLEQAANLCLIALALSDLMFCLAVFPNMFLPDDGRYSSNDNMVAVYHLYQFFVINVFIMESTLLTVAMSLERFVAICFPLRQDLYLTTRRTKYVIAFTVLFSVAFNVPVLFRYEITPHWGNRSAARPLYWTVEQVKIGGSHALDNGYRWAWAVAGNFIPLILLFYFNVCLWWKIYLSYKMRRQFHRPQQATRSSHILTVTLVAIVVMFFILVAPSETVLALKNAITMEKATGDAIEHVLNLMQTINFSVNFVLYCIISPYFRKTLKYILLCGFYN